jgi:hypothetical protein
VEFAQAFDCCIGVGTVRNRFGQFRMAYRFVSSPLPKHRRQKAICQDPKQKVMVAGEIDSMIKRDYLEAGHLSITVHFFAVPKGDSGIRIVFDGTSSGLNETLGLPNFFLPSPKSAPICLCFNTWMADMDFGEMLYHNFHMDPRIRPFSGVDLGSVSALLPGLAPEHGKIKPRSRLS